MHSRKAIDSTAIGLMFCLSAIWGIQQVMIKAVSAEMAPILQMAIRSGIAAALVFLLVLVKKGKLVSSSTLGPGLLAGLLFALEFLSIGEGLKYTSAAHMVVFIYTAPIFVAVALHWRFPSERLNRVQWSGVLLAFSGVVIAFMSEDTGTQSNMLLGDALGLLGAILWAVTTILIRSTTLSQAPATQTLFYQLFISFILLLLGAFITGQTGFIPSAFVFGNLLFQGVVVSFASLLTWFWLLRQYPASQLGIFAFMTPLMGVIFGVLLLDETTTPAFLNGALLVMFGIGVVNGHNKINNLLGRKTG